MTENESGIAAGMEIRLCMTNAELLMRERFSEKAEEGYTGWDGEYPAEELRNEIFEDADFTNCQQDDSKLVDIMLRCAFLLYRKREGLEREKEPQSLTPPEKPRPKLPDNIEIIDESPDTPTVPLHIYVEDDDEVIVGMIYDYFTELDAVDVCLSSFCNDPEDLLLYIGADSITLAEDWLTEHINKALGVVS